MEECLVSCVRGFVVSWFCTLFNPKIHAPCQITQDRSMDTALIRHFVLHADGTTDVCSSLARIMNGPEPVHAEQEDFALGANSIVKSLLLEVR